MSATGPKDITGVGGETAQRQAEPSPRDPTTDLLSRIWQQNLPLMRDRVACLQQAGSEARLGLLGVERRIEASDLAHKLAGSLGMFGYPRGTEIAREIEHLLEETTDLDGERLFRLIEALHDVLPLNG